MSLSNYFPIWDKMTPEQQNRIQSATEYRKFRAGTVLHQGSLDCLGLLLIRSGQLRAYILSDEGREITISRMFEMDICLFSASCVMPNMQFDIIIEAEKDTELWIIPACLYKDLMDESLPIARFSNDLITNHFSEMMWLVEQVMWKSFDKRLAKFLLEESALEGTPALKITHEKIANHMGSAREVVTRMLRYFQSEGMVKLTRGTVELTDTKRLRQLENA
jgi:CRP/FNR family transcriptional regulator